MTSMREKLDRKLNNLRQVEKQLPDIQFNNCGLNNLVSVVF